MHRVGILVISYVALTQNTGPVSLNYGVNGINALVTCSIGSLAIAAPTKSTPKAIEMGFNSPTVSAAAAAATSKPVIKVANTANCLSDCLVMWNALFNIVVSVSQNFGVNDRTRKTMPKEPRTDYGNTRIKDTKEREIF